MEENIKNQHGLHKFEKGLIHQSNLLHQLGAEFPAVFGFVPWRHHVEIVTKCKTTEEALFYIRKVIDEGLSRNALIDSLKADLYNKAGKALTNFGEMLPDAQGKLAQEIIKNSYDLSFITLPAGYEEEDLEDYIEKNITRFLLELGTGFVYVGRQVEVVL